MATGGEGPTAPRSPWKLPLLVFGATVLLAWAIGTLTVVQLFPRLLYAGLERSVVRSGIGGA